MKKMFKLVAAIAALPLLWLAFVRIFMLNFKIDPITFDDDEVL